MTDKRDELTRELLDPVLDRDHSRISIDGSGLSQIVEGIFSAGDDLKKTNMEQMAALGTVLLSLMEVIIDENQAAAQRS